MLSHLYFLCWFILYCIIHNHPFPYGTTSQWWNSVASNYRLRMTGISSTAKVWSYGFKSNQNKTKHQYEKKKKNHTFVHLQLQLQQNVTFGRDESTMEVKTWAVEGALTHWGRVTQICVSKQAIIGSDNGLSPGRRQAIIWTNAGILLIGPLGTNFSEILIEIHTFSFKKIHPKMSSGNGGHFVSASMC